MSIRVSKSSRYAIANLLFGVVIFAIYKYFQAAMGQSRTGSDAPKIIAIGIVLYICMSVVVVVRLFYRHYRYQVVDESSKTSEAAAYGMLAANKPSVANFALNISAEAFDKLIQEGVLRVDENHLPRSLRKRDKVMVSTATGDYRRQQQTVVSAIDAVNGRIELSIV